MRAPDRSVEGLAKTARDVPQIKWNVRMGALFLALAYAVLFCGAAALFLLYNGRGERRQVQDDRDAKQNSRLDTAEKRLGLLEAANSRQDAQIRELQRQLLGLINADRKRKGLAPLPASAVAPSPSTTPAPEARPAPSSSRPSARTRTVVVPRPGATKTAVRTTTAPAPTPTPTRTPILRLCAPLVGCPLG